ncbi:MAG: energy-coupling factor transporter transmembrane protein EcfT, partial [Muribaculaceae bacterium]|nr:energy-coupling factor transporter transmembrane protein EcfT [Muribaculaceae bacterium]
MADLEKTYLRLLASGTGSEIEYPAPSMLAVTIIFLVAVLSVPVEAPQKLIWLSAYPIAASEITGIGFRKIFIRSLWITPFLAMIGMFNPILDTQTAFSIGNVAISTGWVSFVSILLRGLLSLQAVLILISNIGFLNLFNALRRIGLPKVLTTQLLLTYRYLSVIIEEAIIMKRARKARGFGKKSYPLKDWGIFVGQLLIISSRKATEIHNAMLARGFSGTMPLGKALPMNSKGWFWIGIWTLIIILLRFVDFSTLILN